MPAKASPAGPPVTAAVSSPVPPKKAGAESSSKAKSKAAGKPLLATEKVETPCIFHQMPSGCIHGAERMYSHVESPAPAKDRVDPEASAKPKPKQAAPKVVAAVAIIAALVLADTWFPLKLRESRVIMTVPFLALQMIPMKT